MDGWEDYAMTQLEWRNRQQWCSGNLSECLFCTRKHTHTHKHRVRGKFLDDDLSVCTDTPSCLLWWMSNTCALCSVLYIEAVTLACCSTTLADRPIVPARLTVNQSPEVAGHPLAHARTQVHTTAQPPKASCCCAQHHASESPQIENNWQ